MASTTAQPLPAILPTSTTTARGVWTRESAIFVTHNPNIPVLAEAEQVIVRESNGTAAHKANEGSVDACKDALAQPPQAVVHATPGETSLFCGNELVFYSDRIELCGVTVVRDELRIRKILEILKERLPNGRYVAYSGVKLAQAMGLRGGQNGIAEAIEDFRDEVEEALKAQGHLFSRKDVIQSGGAGYRLAEWIVVREAYRA